MQDCFSFDFSAKYKLDFFCEIQSSSSSLVFRVMSIFWFFSCRTLWCQGSSSDPTCQLSAACDPTAAGGFWRDSRRAIERGRRRERVSETSSDHQLLPLYGVFGGLSTRLWETHTAFTVGWIICKRLFPQSPRRAICRFTKKSQYRVTINIIVKSVKVLTNLNLFADFCLLMCSLLHVMMWTVHSREYFVYMQSKSRFFLSVQRFHFSFSF